MEVKRNWKLGCCCFCCKFAYFMPWLLYFTPRTHQQHNNKASKKNIIIFISFKINPITLHFFVFHSPPTLPATVRSFHSSRVWVCSRFNFDLKSNTFHNQQPTPHATQLEVFLNEFKMCLKGERDLKFNFIYTAKFMQHHMSEKGWDWRYLNSRSHQDNLKHWNLITHINILI